MVETSQEDYVRPVCALLSLNFSKQAMPHFTPGLSTVPGSQALRKHRKVMYVVDTGTLTDCCQCDASSHKGLTE